MKRGIYVILGLLIGAFIAANLMMDASKLQNEHLYKETNEVGLVDEIEEGIQPTKNTFLKEQINRLDTLINELSLKEGYFVTNEKLNNYINSKVVVYGRANPMLYTKMDVVIEDEEVNDFEVEDVDEFLTAEGDSIGYNLEENKLTILDVSYIEEAFKKDGILPVNSKYYGITSKFGLRNDPINKNETRFHVGLDIAKSGINGQQVFATLDGRVDLAINNGGYGNYVVINHGGFNTVYAHLEGFGRDIEEGKIVKAGDVIGYVGSTGRSTGAHLHFEVETEGVKLNPEHFTNIILGGSTPKQEGYWPSIEKGKEDTDKDDDKNDKNNEKLEEDE